MLTVEQYAFIIEQLFLVSTTCTKLSVLLFYRRLVKGTYSHRFKVAVWIAIAFVIISWIVFTVLVIVTCTPMSGYWMQYDLKARASGKYKCTSQHLVVALSKLSGSWSVISDFYSIMLPAALLMRIKTNPRQRWGLMFIFSVGYM
jgi:hypothetical protein